MNLNLLNFTLSNLAFLLFILIVLTVFSVYDYLLFHTLAGLFSIIVAWCIFIIAWNSRKIINNAYYMILGAAYLCIGGLDLVHTLSFKGMPFFSEYDSNLPTQLWICARYIESLSLAAALLLMHRQINAEKITMFYGACFVLVIAAVFSKTFPDCFIEGSGLTHFKIISEYIICVILIGVMFLLFKRRANFDPYVFWLLYYAVLLTIGAELAFTFYISVYELYNLIGHLFKLISIYLIYLALIENSLSKPFRLLFWELNHYKIIMNTIQNPISLVNRDYIYQAVNQAYIHIAKKPRQEIIGMSVEQLLGKEVFESKVKHYLDRCFSGEQVHYQTWFNPPDSPPIFMNVSYHPLVEPNGKITGAVMNSRDITYLKQTEDVLRENANRFRSMFENHHAVMLLIDPETGKIIQANRSAEQYYGYSHEDFMKMKIFDINQLSQKQIMQEMNQAILEQQNLFYFRHQLASGEIRDVEIHSSPIRYQDQMILFSIVHDITERKTAEKALRESEEKFFKAFQACPVTMSISTLDEGVFVDVNAEFIKITGYNREDVIGRRAVELNLWDSGSSRDAIIAEIKQKGFAHEKEVSLITKTGEVRHLLWYGDVVTINNRPCLIATGYDLTERKQAERKLQEYTHHLEEMVSERTRKLENTQAELLKKERLAVLGHFAGNIAHEIRNPLSVIETAAYILQNKPNSDDQSGYHLVYIRENVQKITAIIESLLSLTRLKAPMVLSVELEKLVSVIISEAKIPDTVELVWDKPATEVLVKIDPEQFRMALKNVIKNAIQAMEGVGRLMLSINAGTQCIELTVKDTGPGILPEHLDKIFQPLFTTKDHGTGFGLPLTKMIMEKHGGTVRAVSAPGAGAMFIFSFGVGSNLELDNYIDTTQLK